MVEFARPGFLWAGLILALLPPLLHLIARRPRERVALPTARFLAPDARSTVRLQRRPMDLLLLLLRSLFLILLGAALAGPTWREGAEGSLELVLLDRGIGGGWPEAVDSARSLLLGRAGTPAGDLVLFDTTAVRIPAGELSAPLFDSLAAAPTAAPRAEYAAALRAARAAARAHPAADSLRLTLITRPRWEGWSPGLAPLRAAAWPGRIRLLSVGDPQDGSAAVPDPAAAADGSRVAGVRAEEAVGPYLEAALAALGWTIARLTAAGEVASLLVAAGPLSADAEADLLARARAGAVVVVAGEVPVGPLGDGLPWRADSAGPPAPDTPGALVPRDGAALTGAASRSAGSPAPGAAVLAAWEDGRPAAAAVREGSGCLVYLGAALGADGLLLSPGFPWLLDLLSRGCEPERLRAGERRGPLDGGALALLEGRDLPPTVAARGLDEGGGGRPLDRWLLFAALGLALGEAGLAYGRRKG